MKEENPPNNFQHQFENDVRNGLTASQKYLYSKYFYDERGDKLFQQIMALPEYYLTNCEFNILQEKKELISEIFKDEKGFDLIELGAGDGKKTKILLEYWLRKQFDFKYLPIDISKNALDGLESSLKEEFPQLKMETKQGTYFEVLNELSDFNQRKKVIMVLGSNIGNLLHPQAVDFLKQIKNAMADNDLLFIGFDQKKDPQVILNAYNDKKGVTAAFNLNVLLRINKELNANFDLSKFMHWPTYNPQTGTTKSFLISKKEQEVQIKKLKLKVHFDAFESIHTEISQKYDNATVKWLANQADLEVVEVFTDKEKYYKNYIFKRRK